MARNFTLSAGSGYSIVPEGVHIFRVDSIDYKEVYGKMEVVLVTKDGIKHTERYGLMDDKGQTNQGAMNAFSYFAKCALNNFDAVEIDLDDLIGRYIEASVTHEQVPKRNGKPGEMSTFARLGDKAPASGFDPAPQASEERPSKPTYDLDSILG